MIGNSYTYPEITIKSNNKTQIRFNIIETTYQDINNESHISYNFSYVEIEGEVTRDKIISAIIRNTHSIDAEIALINNELLNPNNDEYIEYQTLRTLAKSVADLAGYSKID